MNIIFNILIAILAFSVLIFVHELGHFIAAKSLKVKVTGFSIGMGPKLWSRKRGDTLYAIRAVPVGGFCAMEGEEDESADDRSLSRKPIWARLIIFAAGSAANLLFGFILILALTLTRQQLVLPVIDGLAPEVGDNLGGIIVGDRILSINGERIYIADDFTALCELFDPPYDLVVLRDGQKVSFVGDFAPQDIYNAELGMTEKRYGVTLAVEPNNLGRSIDYAIRNARDDLRLVRLSLAQLLSGRAGLSELSGPVGITAVMGDALSKSNGFLSLLGILAFISINLSFMNLLPLPALDGGHIIFLCLELLIIGVNHILSLFTKRRIPKVKTKYEAYVHFAGLVVFMGFFAFATYNDIVRLIK